MHFVSEGNILNWLTKAIFYPGHVMPTNVVFKPDGAPKRSLWSFSVAGFYSVAFFFSSFSSIRHILISYFTFQIKILEKSTFKKIPPKSISSKVLLHLRFSPFDKSSQIKMPKEKLTLVMLHCCCCCRCCCRCCCCCCLPSLKERCNWRSKTHNGISHRKLMTDDIEKLSSLLTSVDQYWSKVCGVIFEIST